MADIKTAFTDAIISKAPFTIKENLGNTVGQPQDGSQSGVAGTVSPKELPSTSSDLWHGTQS